MVVETLVRSEPSLAKEEVVVKKAVVLLSGGLDSTVTAYIARKDIGKKGELYALTLNYGQRHSNRETSCAIHQVQVLQGRKHLILPLPLGILGKSSLVWDGEIPTEGLQSGIPSTWVPQRNSIFLALAFAYAETVGADYVYAGMNFLDYSGS